MSDVTYTAVWAKCSSCAASYLREPEDGDNCHLCLRAKAAAFDVLSDRIAARDWTIRAANIGGVVLADNRTGEQFYTDTLAEAVKAAMEAEGER